MTSCSVIISNFNSLPFLRACVRSIRNNAHSEILTKIIVADQSTLLEHEKICEEYWYDEEIKIVWTAPLYSGFGLDWIFRNINIETEYICQIHTDVLAISQNFLYVPIKLIEEYNLSFVGQIQFVNDKNNLASIYPPHPFFAMAQCYNIAKTETYKEMSLEAGFTRYHNRKQSGLTFLNDDWSQWASDDYENKGSDDDVVAFAWEAKYRNTNKLGLAVSGFIEPAYGRVIDDLVFHFGSARESIGVMHLMPELYKSYTQKIYEDYSDELISEMVEMAKKNKPNGTEILSRNLWDGKLKKRIPIPDELNKRIEELKNT